MQLHRNVNGGETLLLILSQEIRKVRQKALLSLYDLLLKRVDLNHQYADLRRISSCAEQFFELLLSLCDPLEERRDRGLPRLQQLSENRLLRRLQLQELNNDLKR